MSTRENIIRDIVSYRQQNKAGIETKISCINELDARLQELSRTREYILSQGDSNDAAGLQEIEGNISGIREKLNTLRIELQRLLNRYSRDTVNIGIVGVPKQGKSTFLQSLTGLDEAIIPTGFKWVTGACSYLRHDPTVAKGDAFAIITPYTRNEFLEEVITPFTNSLNIPRLFDPEDLRTLRLPDISELPRKEQHMQLERLAELKANYDKYEHLLGRSELRIERKDIRSYVAQCDEECRVKYTNWYVVKKAEIHCCFPHEDIGKVMICDTPGLGDFTPGAQKSLVERLGNGMDFIFLLRRFDEKEQEVRETDADFYNVIREAYPIFDVPDWAYLILNRSAHENVPALYIDELQRKLATRKGVFALNAKDKESVGAAFQSILGDVVNQLPVLDKKLSSHCNTLLADLSQSITELTKKAQRSMNSALPSHRTRTNDVKQILRNITTRILQLQADLASGVALAGVPSFAQYLKDTLSTMYSEVPALESDIVDEQNAQEWMGEGWDKLRAAFIARFASLDTTLNAVSSAVKARLQDILTSADGGRLAFVSDTPEGPEFWQDLREVLDETLQEHATHLIAAIDNLLNTQLSFRALIMPRLHDLTDALSTKSTHPAFEYCRYTQGSTLEECRVRLQSAWKIAVSLASSMFSDDDDGGELKDINIAPTQAMLALIDEFYLLWLRHNGKSASENNWFEFYQKHETNVWPEIYQNEQSCFAMNRRWNNAVAKVSETLNKLSK